MIYAHILPAPKHADDTDVQIPETILPGNAHGYQFIAEASGLLSTNKQLHDEACEYLFSKNGFMIMPE